MSLLGVRQRMPWIVLVMLMAIAFAVACLCVHDHSHEALQRVVDAAAVVPAVIVVWVPLALAAVPLAAASRRATRPSLTLADLQRFLF